MAAYEELLNDKSDKPKALWVKTRKGRGYGKFDNDSHGSPHKQNSKEFWTTKKEFAEKYGLKFQYMDQSMTGNFETDKSHMADTLETVMSVFDQNPEFLDYLAERLLELGESIPTESESTKVFDKNPLDDAALFDYKNYPKELFKAPGEKAPNRAGLGAWGSWINTYCQKKYNRPFLLASSADLAGSTNISGCADGWCGFDDFGMYDRKKNLKGTLLPQPITEFANAGIMTGISAMNFSKKPFDEFNGFYTTSSTYGSFSYLKYGVMRIYSQMAQDSQIKLGKTIWVAGHTGPETAEDSRTHFGIFAPEVTQLFPKGHIINLHPWEYNEVPVMLAAAMQTDVPIIALHLTRPPVEIPDRAALGMPSYFEAAKGAYIIKDYDPSRKKEGVVMVRGTKVVDELLQILNRLKKEGPNVKIVAVLSNSLFRNQTQAYQDSIIAPNEWVDAMIITNTSIHQMSRWVMNPVVKAYSLSPDWDNQWRSGGKLEEVMDEARLSAKWQWDGIVKFAADREKRLTKIRMGIPE
jgi:transketolase